MASSPVSRRGLIAQLSQRQRRDHYSASPSPSPHRIARDDGNNTDTVSSFHPEQESTQQFDTATQDQQGQDDYSVDSAAEMPGHDEDESQSIELGRGAAANIYSMDEQISENPILSLGNDSLYELTATPPLRSVSGRKQHENQYNSLRKQASVRRASNLPQPDITKTSDIVPVKTRSAATSNRRTLSDMHAKVRQESDSSMVEDVRQQAHATGRKDGKSRFAGSRSTHAGQAIPTRFTAGAGLNSPVEQTPRRTMSAADIAHVGNQTAQSFMLPNLPDLTELVSGVRKDGTPVFSKTQKSRSRFTSASYARAGNKDVTEHARLHSIPLPDEEKAIFASLQLLKDKVAHMEIERSEATKRLEEYETQVIQLKARLEAEKRLRRSDSAFASDVEGGIREEKRRMEMSNLQASLKMAQDRLERSERKASVSEIAVKRITHERDNLVTQLGVAFYSNEELKDESAGLREENEALQQRNIDMRHDLSAVRSTNTNLKSQLARLHAQHEDEVRQWEQRETELKDRLRHREENTRRDKNQARNMSSTEQADDGHTSSGRTQSRRSSAGLGQDTQNEIVDRVEEEIRKIRNETSQKAKLAVDKARNRTRSRSKSQPRTGRSTEARHPENDQPAGHKDAAQRKTNNAKRSSVVEGNDRDGLAELDDDDSKDVTYLSLLDPNELAKLRKKLEEERQASKQDRPTLVSRKSSLKDITKTLGITGPLHAVTEEATTGASRNVRIQSPHTSDAISYQAGDHTNDDASVLSTGSRRPQSKSFQEMTSAFILPDITLGQGTLIEQVEHDKDNCTFCPDGATSKSPEIPRPVPVTDRDIDETSATVRPSQSPPIALATVMKQLQDEVTHLKLKLAAYEQTYAAHDPALGRRKRKAIKAKIDTLLCEIERRSEQIYALYDVLEGQKHENGPAEGRVLDEEQVEETLQSLGIDPARLAQKAARAAMSGGVRRPRGGEDRGAVDALAGLLNDSDDEAHLNDSSDEE